ncbi:pre-mRNA-splicing factor ATP-dependent RNA helicase-like [Raphidocelis subcapitata]|uniref:RNA helicase n=1 Tax=Raphidocelis subcapitata TaxID=307507 RepID=A0A2V0PFP8_9CHLO|nr:pre-mRNA-splicing factor ATP-dependent RNA helicase-like [Raphidocelis subcapitata]|eukprot:GBF98616.1 pre-mRNA-splicing factor ATP-dependent RNA helicase-like [Raphidocelis subcapitata]
MEPADGPKLPIRQYGDEIARAVAANDVVVVIGETGSGKTTQLSQILLEAGFASEGIIGVTQPRRVAAVTVARRVAEERGAQVGGEVGYAVRFEDRSCPSTRIKYLTDGTLMRECLEDPMLSKYQVVILDEAHERSLNTDILFGLLKNLAGVREKPLKLVVTSATLDGDKFSSYFNDCPVFNVPGRCFPVDIVHSREDHAHDYVSAAVDTVLQIHTGQPAGDILVFLTGQAEIEKAVASINAAVCSLPAGSASDLLVLPLYASLPPELQLRVFRGGPEGARRCIVATNVAETSITVEGVVYVVDSGVVKQKHYHPASGMESLDVVPISRVQATQRAGRAGRTRPGKCFRLYTRTYFEHQMPDASLPEIQRCSLAGAVLHLKALKLPLDVLAFDFLDPPAKGGLEEALSRLYVLDAIDADGDITPPGRAMAAMPLEPALARALLAAHKLGCLDEMVTVAAMLSAEHVFAGGHGPDVGNGLAPGGGGGGGGGGGRGGGGGGGRREELSRLMAECQGDHILLLRLYQLWAAGGCSREFCKQYGLDLRGMNFARDVRRQLEGIVGPNGRGLEKLDAGGGDDGGDRRGRDGGGGGSSHAPDRDRDGDGGGRKRRRSGSGEPPPLTPRGSGGLNGRGGSAPPPSAARLDALRHALTVGFANRIARRMRMHNGYKTVNEAAQLAQLHPGSSHLKADDDGLLPEWVIYHELVATSRPFLRQVCPVEYRWVEPLLPKLSGVDVRRLSKGRLLAEREEAAAGAGASRGGAAAAAAAAGSADAAAAAATAAAQAVKRNDDKAVDAARQRYLARKQQQAAAAGPKKR